jgi:uncharacterized coiled-coil protein SlyX
MTDSNETQSGGETVVQELNLAQQLTEAESLIELQRSKLDAVRTALKHGQVAHAIDILS